tara:strand:- start:87 stop:356 length:270 start_codon:yes stop_codon:yes gene_type:complete
MGTDEVIKIISELGLPIAISLGLAFVLYRVVMWLLRDVVESTLRRFDTKHKVLAEKMDYNIDKTERCEKKLTEIKSDLKVYVDLTMKGK